MGKQCFIFSTRWDAEVYAYLKANHHGEVDEAENAAKADKTFAPDENLLDELPDIMADRLREIFTNEAPMPCDPQVLNAEDIYGELLADAIAGIDFRQIARAFLEDVELPPSPPLPEVL